MWPPASNCCFYSILTGQIMNIEFIFAYFLTPIAKWHWNKKKWTKHVVLLIWVSSDDLALECSLLHAEQIAVWGPNYEIFLSVTLLVNSNLPRQTLFIAKSSQNTFGLRAVHLLSITLQNGPNHVVLCQYPSFKEWARLFYDFQPLLMYIVHF